MLKKGMNASKTAAGKVDPPPFIGWLAYFSVRIRVSMSTIPSIVFSIPKPKPVRMPYPVQIGRQR